MKKLLNLFIIFVTFLVDYECIDKLLDCKYKKPPLKKSFFYILSVDLVKYNKNNIIK